MSNKKILLEYAQLKLEEKRIQNNLELLKPEVLKEVQEIRGDSDQPVSLSELPGSSFTITTRKTWEYSPFTEKLANELKERKKIEEANGTATFTESQQLMFLAPKE